MVLYGAAPWLLKWWSHGRIPFQPMPMLILLAYAAVVGVWHVPRVLLLSTNQHSDLAQWSLAGAALSVLCTIALQAPWGMTGACVAMLISELAMAGQCIRLAHGFLRSAAHFRPGWGHT